MVGSLTGIGDAAPTDSKGSYGSPGVRTVSGVDLGQRALCLADEDGSLGVVLLHCRVRSREEGPAGLLVSTLCLLSALCWEEGVRASRTGGGATHRTAALCSEVWQKRKRTSLRDLVKAYLADIVAVWCSGRVVEGYSGEFRSRLSCVPGSIGRWAWDEVGGDGLVWRFEALDRQDWFGGAVIGWMVLHKLCRDSLMGVSWLHKWRVTERMTGEAHIGRFKWYHL
jgi:hypothetical protein